MYSDFYGFTGLPFQLTPDHRFFFGSRNHKKALSYLTYGLSQGEGFIVVTGDIGAGKTTLVGHLLSMLDRDSYVAGTVVTSQLDADNMLRTVAAAFGLQIAGHDKAELLHSLEHFLRTVHRNGKRAVLIVDEVQNVPVGALEELRMLSNFQDGERPLLQSFLLGQPQFRPTLASEAMEQLRQRVIATYHLGPMDASETQAYVEHRLRLVGWQNNPEMSEDAFQQIYRHTGGVPRRINTLCTRIFLLGALEERDRIDAACVEEVVRDLQQERTSVDVTRDIELPAIAPPAPVNGASAPHPIALESEELATRVLALEKTVQQHEQTIRRAFDIALQYLAAGPSGERVRQMEGS